MRVALQGSPRPRWGTQMAPRAADADCRRCTRCRCGADGAGAPRACVHVRRSSPQLGEAYSSRCGFCGLLAHASSSRGRDLMCSSSVGPVLDLQQRRPCWMPSWLSQRSSESVPWAPAWGETGNLETATTSDRTFCVVGVSTCVVLFRRFRTKSKGRPCFKERMGPVLPRS